MLFAWAQGEEEGAYTWTFFGNKFTRLFNHIYDKNNEDNLSYLGKIKGAGTVETIELEYSDSESNKWDKEEKSYIDSWKIGTYDGDKIAKSVFNKIKQAKKDSEIDDINLTANRIYIGNFTIGDKKYPVATYSPKGAVSGLKKITVTDSDVLERTDTIKHIYCDETYTKYLIIAFYKDGAEKSDPSLIMQIEKFVGDDTKDKWLKYLGVLVEEDNESKKGNKEIIVEIERIRNNDHRTVGKINIDNGAITGYTLELPKGSDSECKSACTDSKKIDNECKRIVQGTYTFGITTWSDKADFINKSLRLNNIPGRTGILMHRGVNARIWSYGCILAMRNDPTNDKDDAGPSERANKIDDSEAFCVEIVDYIKKRSNEIKKEYSIDEVVMKIIITENNEIKD